MDATQKVPSAAHKDEGKEELHSQSSAQTQDPKDLRIAELEQKLEEKTNDYLRALADFRNLQRQTQQERVAFVSMATANVLGELLQPLDHLEMTMAHVKDPALSLVIKQFQQILENEGVKEIDVQGKTFDPKTMEAVESVSGKKDIVIAVKQKGYMIHDTVLRPARVEVGNGELSTT